jgi:prepilin-type N-terminal cleavage/methylation domain-containing protein
MRLDRVKSGKKRRSEGFTLIELLVVIGIIAILVALLIPVVGKIRQSAYGASTQNEIGQIGDACQRYYDDFKAYPGPISNSDLESQPGIPYGSSNTPQPAPATPPANILDSQTSTIIINNQGGTPKYILTASENLVLGLLGGLQYCPVSSNTPTITAAGVYYIDGGTGLPNTLIGAGPQNLSPYAAGSPPTSVKQYTSYMGVTFPGSPYLLNGDGSTEKGMTVTSNGVTVLPAPYSDASGKSFGDSIVPVFTDQYPDHMPILYVRARKGAKGVISDGMLPDPTNTGSPNTPAHYNYDLRELTPYTAMTVNGGVPTTWTANPPTASQGTATGIASTGAGREGEHGLQEVGLLDIAAFSATAANPGGELSTQKWNHPVPTNYTYSGAAVTAAWQNAGQYFLNPSVQPSNINSPAFENATGSPRGKDEFILISAGPDRTYGTEDDLTNFGSVEP